jgi:hypothetical protein
MLQEEAKRIAIQRWGALPKAERQSEAQAASFAMSIKDDLPFRSAGDPYQVIKGWLINDLHQWGRLGE